MYKKVIAILIIIFLAFPLFASAEEFVPLPDSANGGIGPSVTGTGAMLVDLQTNTVLFSKNANTKCAPASMTKMMTLLISFENSADPKTETVTVPEEALNISADSSRAYIEPGDVMTVEDLLYALMLPSGNDAAMALAVHFGQTVSGFVDMMNQKAQELGMTGTHFANPHGLDDPEHYTTPHDLALLGCELARRPELTAITSTYSYKLQAVRDGTPTQWTVYNTNDMVNNKNSAYMAGVMGLKTGYTIPAGNCLTSYYEKDGRQLVCVITHAGTNGAVFSDTRKVLEYGIDNYSTINLTDIFTNQTYRVDVSNYAEDDEFNGQLELYLTPGDPIYYTTTKTLAEKILGGVDPLLVQMPSELTAPVTIGDVMGTITFSLQGETLYSAEARAARTIHKNIPIPSSLKELTGLKTTSPFRFFLQPKVYLSIAALVILVLAGYILFVLRRRSRRRIVQRQRNIVGRAGGKRNRL